MATIISGDTGIDKITDGSVVAADLASTLDLSGKTITLATDAVDQLSTASGSAPSYSARAWVNFNGTTASINGNGNVSSITDHGTGQFTINFTTALPNTNYSWCGTNRDANDNDFVSNIVSAKLSATKSTSALRITTTSGDGAVLTDFPETCVIIIG